MIPLRIQLKGFLSYRDEATLSFDGAPLWALVGRNGAGKSALFDAITFVLYGVHRAGKQHHHDLINHQSDALSVEYEFQLGDDLYRVKRTIAKPNRSSFQAWQLRRDLPDPRWQPIVGTESRVGFDQWVQSTIGLGADTFTASVLLQQGRADAMLTTDPAGRHTMLGQLIDLQVYERLYQRAVGHHGEFSTRKSVLADNLLRTPPVDPRELALLSEQIEQAHGEEQATRAELDHLIALKALATQWEELTGRLATLRIEQERAVALLTQAAQIEERATRRRELTNVVPRLCSLLAERTARQVCADRIARYECDAQQREQELRQAGEAHGTARDEHDRLVAKQTGAQRQHTAALEALAALAPQIAALDDLDRARGELAKVEHSLGQFPDDLETRLEAQRHDVAVLAELRTALPWLRQYAGERTTWRAAASRALGAAAAITDAEALRAVLAAEIEHVTPQAHQTGEEVSRLSHVVTESETLLSETRKQLRRFHEVEGKPTCTYCGQPLTPEHLEVERERLQNELESAKERVEQRKQVHREADSTAAALASRLDQLQADHQNVLNSLRDHQRSYERAADDQAGAANQACSALQALPVQYQVRIRAGAPCDVESLAIGTYPSDSDLADTKVHVSGYTQAVAVLNRLQSEQRDRDDLRVKQRGAEDRAHAAQQRCPADPEPEIRARNATAHQTAEEARATLDTLAGAIIAAALKRDAADAAERQAETQLQNVTRDRVQEQARQEAVTRNIATLLSQLPEQWRDIGGSLDVDGLQSLTQEHAALADAEEEAAELATARQQHAIRAQQIVDLTDQLQQIPEAARRAATDVARDEIAVGERHADASKAHQTAQGRKQALEVQDTLRHDWEQQHRKAAHSAYLYGELAHLLGRDELQRHLMRQAETGIVARANEVLDRISGGMLELQLRHDTHDLADVATAKALDMVAYNRATGTEPVRVALLSGSQRFRVAVSLAIGIGRYAGQSSRRMESVIIDEGFGSLDREGLRDMADELRRLGDALGRIILVSHQEEFANEFRHKYEIKLEDGTSTATLVTA